MTLRWAAAVFVAAGLASGCSLFAETAPWPADVNGLTVHSISELMEARSSGSLEGGPIALAGFWTMRQLGHSCAPPDGPVGDLEIRCHDGEWGITEAREPIVTWDDGRMIPATGAHLTPFLSEEHARELFTAGGPIPEEAPPIAVVLIGHLDDPRAADCAPEKLRLCLDRFVVDEIAQIGEPGSTD